ncbi:hypothetical protein Q9R19_04600 [Microbacterium sp. ARD32]|uniref:hypothetical protein n=1 Tax=Microbacterium sp. ARD32 TaxID=2962577 RepID=UPI002881F337|nr:hypothetical protein [Microbacterium sp. ARD32]MDT0156904.1 hypothetical protein [Microbacterium sp. ARD32]
MNIGIRPLSLTAAALLSLGMLSGCSGAPGQPASDGGDSAAGQASHEQNSEGQDSDGQEAEEQQSDHEQVGEDEDQGSVTLTLTGGENAGEYTGTGSLKCGYGDFVPDSWWVVFAGDDDAQDKVYIANIWLAADAHVDDEKSPYPGTKFTATALTGNAFVPGKGAQFASGDDEGGTAPSAERDGDTVTFTGTWSDGTGYSLVAECPRVKSS